MQYFLTLALGIMLVSCAPAIRPISSTPPASKIRVNKPFKWGDGVITIKLDFPTGEYLPKYEDDKGYFYDAPQKITGYDTFWPLLVDGGLYLEKGLPKPKKIYIIRNQMGVPGKIDVGDRVDVTMYR